MFPFRYSAFRRTRKQLVPPDALDARVFRLPWREFRSDLVTWSAAGVLMVLIYHGFYTPYPTTGLKIFIGCVGFGLFSGMLSYLDTESHIINALADSPIQDAPDSTLTVSRKMLILVVTVLCLMALTILMMVLLDVWYLIENSNASAPGVYWGVFKEIAFTLVILLGVSLVILNRYSANIARTLQLQLAAMVDISRGNLEKQVPVLSSDEFARYARETNAMLTGLQERELCQTSFGKYVSPEVSHKILQGDISPQGDLLDVTILFCDLRGYTSFVENRNPREVVTFMNHYFETMEGIITRCGGVVLQYIGDEIEAVFGAPTVSDDHAHKAVEAAEGMRRALAQINSARKGQGETPVSHGIGINSGTVLAGNVGSAKRMVYAMVGDTVNIAARLQVLNKSLGTDILLSKNTVTRIAHQPERFKSMGRHAIRGKTEAVDVYSLSR